MRGSSLGSEGETKAVGISEKERLGQGDRRGSGLRRVQWPMANGLWLASGRCDFETSLLGPGTGLKQFVYSWVQMIVAGTWPSAFLGFTGSSR